LRIIENVKIKRRTYYFVQVHRECSVKVYRIRKERFTNYLDSWKKKQNSDLQWGNLSLLFLLQPHRLTEKSCTVCPLRPHSWMGIQSSQDRKSWQLWFHWALDRLIWYAPIVMRRLNQAHKLLRGLSRTFLLESLHCLDVFGVAV